jgi:hypothetical protein
MASKKDRLTNDLSKYVGLGQWAKAVQTLQSLIQLEPTNTHYYLRMGDYSLKAGNKPAAIKYYYQAADMYVKAGFTVKGIATYKMILKIAPDETQANTLMKSINAISGLGLAEEFMAPISSVPEVAATKEADLSKSEESRLDEGAAISLETPEAIDEVAEATTATDLFQAGLPVSEDMEDLTPDARLAAEDLSIPVSSASREVVSKRIEKKNINVLFSTFTQDEFGAIVDKLEPLEFMDGERIVAEGDEGDGMYLITRGGGKVIKDHNGNEVELCELGEGEFFGELSLLSGGLRSASVFAKGETEALRLRSADLFEVIKQYPRLENVLEQFSQSMKQKMRALPE